jgi:hypothetical protein
MIMPASVDDRGNALPSIPTQATVAGFLLGAGVVRLAEG